MSRRRCPKLERAVVEAYRAEIVSQSEIGARFGRSAWTIGDILAKHDALDPNRRSLVKRRQWRAGIYAHVQFPRGRKPVWPDCPPELERDYRTLRNHGYPAAEARAMLERLAA